MSALLHSRLPALAAAVLLATILSAPTAHAQWWDRIGLQGIQIGAMARSGTTLIASGPQALYASTDDGRTWEGLASFGGFRQIVSGDDGLIAAVTTTLLAISTDGGASWSTLRDDELRDSLGVIWSLAIIPATNTIYLGTTNDVLRSSDNGATWVSHATGLPEGSPHVGTLAVTRDGGLVAGTQGILGGNIYLLEPGAAEWTAIYERPQGLIGEANAVLATAAGSVIASIPELGVIRSSNTGESWAPVTMELQNRELLRTLLSNGPEVLAVTTFGRILVSSDDGVNWQQATPWGLAPGGAQSLLPLGPSRYLAGTSSGIYELRQPADVDAEPASAGHADLALAPNPSRDGTLRIALSPASTERRFTVIDVAGRIVGRGTLAPGLESTSIDGLASGSYIVRVVSGDHVTSRRFVVAR